MARRRNPRPISLGAPGGPDGPPSRIPKQASNIAPIALVLAVVLGVWLLNGRDPGTGTSAATDSGGTTAYGGSYEPIQPATTSASTGADPGRTGTDPASGLPYVAAGDLPPEARQVLALIDAGGPFDYDQDGGTFGNYEGLLPDEPGGYYAEYTVETPGSDDRDARRIIAGDDGERYWTDDHYASFSTVVP